MLHIKIHPLTGAVVATLLAITTGISRDLFAQSTTGAISGTISPAGDLSVQVASDTGLSRHVSVDAHGHYIAGQLPLGTYTVTISRHVARASCRERV